MSFTIEAPAEANPLTIQTLFHVLQSASSSDQQQVQTGAQQLKNWDTHLGFYQLLQTLYLDYSLPVELRYLSVIHLKVWFSEFGSFDIVAIKGKLFSLRDR